jgi:hypothetical protein
LREINDVGLAKRRKNKLQTRGFDISTIVAAGKPDTRLTKNPEKNYITRQGLSDTPPSQRAYLDEELGSGLAVRIGKLQQSMV